MSTNRGRVPWPWDSTTWKDIANWYSGPIRHTCGECVYRIISRKGIAMCAYLLVKEDRAHVPGERDAACGSFVKAE